jgi:hypothetical protein
MKSEIARSNEEFTSPVAVVSDLFHEVVDARSSRPEVEQVGDRLLWCITCEANDDVPIEQHHLRQRRHSDNAFVGRRREL